MTNVLLAELVSMSVPLARYLKAIYIKSILKLAPIAEHVLMFVPPKLYTRNSIFQEKSINGGRLNLPPFFFQTTVYR